MVTPDAQGIQEIDTDLMPHGSCKRIAIDVGKGRFDNPWIVGSRCVDPR